MCGFSCVICIYCLTSVLNCCCPLYRDPLLLESLGSPVAMETVPFLSPQSILAPCAPLYDCSRKRTEHFSTLVSRFRSVSGVCVKRYPVYHLIACQYGFPYSAMKRVSTAMSHTFTEYRDWLVTGPGFNNQNMAH